MLGFLLVANNHIVNNTGGSSAVSLPQASVTNTIQIYNNVTQTVATATSQGFTIVDLLEPQSDTTALYRTGTPMSVSPYNLLTDRLGVDRSVPPDIGSYQYGATPPPPPRILRAVLARASVVTVE